MGFKRYFLILSMLFAGATAQAAILWAGGEDVDFPNGNQITADTTAARFRSGYARESIYATTGIAKSTTFAGGAVTSAWLSFRLYSVGNAPASWRLVGLGKAGTNNSLWIGTTGNNLRLALWKYDGTTWTQLATASIDTLQGWCCFGGALNDGAIVMQLTNYGATATVNVYHSTNQSAAPLFSYTGDVTAGGNTNLNSVFLIGSPGTLQMSEIIVSDVDPRTYSLVTLAPSAAGDLNQWTNTYTNVNPTTINDTNYVYDNTSGNKFQCNLNDLPAGSFSVLGIKVTARAQQISGGMTSLSVGVKTNATVNAPTAVTLPTSFNSTETFYSTNPVTSSAWTPTEANNLQINLQTSP